MSEMMKAIKFRFGRGSRIQASSGYVGTVVEVSEKIPDTAVHEMDRGQPGYYVYFDLMDERVQGAARLPNGAWTKIPDCYKKDLHTSLSWVREEDAEEWKGGELHKAPRYGDEG